MPALLSDGTWATDLTGILDPNVDDPPSDGTDTVVHTWAESATRVHTIGIVNDSPPIYHRYSPDGGADGTFPAGTEGVNALVLPYRDGMFRVLVFENLDASGGGVLGGEYASADGLSWAKTGRANAHIKEDGFEVSPMLNAIGWAATSDHMYYLMETEQHDVGTAGYVLLVDSQTNGTPETQRVMRIGTVSGGSFLLERGTTRTAPIAWDADNATILAALNGQMYNTGTDLPTDRNWFGASGGSVTGAIATDDLDITFPRNIPQPRLSIDSSSLTGGGRLDVKQITPCSGCTMFEGVKQRIRMSTGGTVSGGTFTLDVLDQTTGPINWNDSGATIVAALNLLSTFDGAYVSGTLAGDDLLIDWSTYGPQPTIGVDNTSITGGGSIGVLTLVRGRTSNSNHPEAEVGSVNTIWGAIDADVCMIETFDSDGSRWIEKIINTAAPVDVTPIALGFLAFDEVFRMRSKDGTTWVASVFMDALGGNNLITSHDQGATWTLTTTGIDASDGWLDVVPDPVTAGTWWAIAKANAFQAFLYRSIDDGDSWSLIGDPVFLEDPTHAVPIGGKVH